jgi:hypothetical protein
MLFTPVVPSDVLVVLVPTVARFAPAELTLKIQVADHEILLLAVVTFSLIVQFPAGHEVEFGFPLGE